jgi:hypothetical protein
MQQVALTVDYSGEMTCPRFVPPKSYCFVTRRCSQRKFLLKPSKAANRAFEYCLAWAAQTTGVKVLFAVVLSNHYLCAAAHNRCYGPHTVMRSGVRVGHAVLESERSVATGCT